MPKEWKLRGEWKSTAVNVEKRSVNINANAIKCLWFVAAVACQMYVVRSLSLFELKSQRIKEEKKTLCRFNALCILKININNTNEKKKCSTPVWEMHYAECVEMNSLWWVSAFIFPLLFLPLNAANNDGILVTHQNIEMFTEWIFSFLLHSYNVYTSEAKQILCLFDLFFFLNIFCYSNEIRRSAARPFLSHSNFAEYITVHYSFSNNFSKDLWQTWECIK